MENELNLQRNPLKLYIQDIYRAKRTAQNKYIYEIFGLTFKNVMLHGIVTSIYNTTSTSTNLELSDPTGCVQVYYNSSKRNCNVPTPTMKILFQDYAKASTFADENIHIMSKLMGGIAERNKNRINFEEGSYISVVGDIFLDDRDVRVVSAYSCTVTSAERDIVWLEELRYLYEKFYLWNKE